MFQNKKNQLDEMQEQKLLHIEKNTCWFAFWALGLSMIVQMIVFKAVAMSHIAGEWIVFMCMCIYLTSACMKAENPPVHCFTASRDRAKPSRWQT